MNIEHRTCPECGGRLIPIMYGNPGPNMIEAAEKGEIILGGTEIKKINPNWRCEDCNKGFVLKD